MKRIILSSIILFCLGIFSGEAQKLNRALKKEYKTKMKTFKKGKFKITGTSRSLEVSLLKHYEKLDSEKFEEIVIVSENCPTINLCDRKSLTDASSLYATRASSFVKGRVVSEAGYDASERRNDKTDQDKFWAAYEQKVSANVSDALKKSFAVVKKKGKAYEYQSFYLVENEEARKARLNALRQAQEETEASVEWAETVSDFINEVPPANN